jgi:hypothetical protein
VNAMLLLAGFTAGVVFMVLCILGFVVITCNDGVRHIR